MADLYPFKDIPGLLAPEQSGNVKSNALLSAAAALLKSGAYQSTPVSPWAQLGQGVEGLLAGNRAGQDDALKQEALRAAIDQRHMAALQTAAQYRGAGLELPPLLQKILGGMPGSAAPGGPAPGPATGGPAPTTLVGNNPQIPPGPAPAPGGAGGGLPPGLFSPQPMAQTPPASIAPAPQPAPAPAPGATPPGVAGLIRQLPTADRFSLIGGGAPGKIVQQVVAKNAETTPDMKNAGASGKSSPFTYNADLKNAEKTPDQKAAEQAGFKDVPSYLAHVEAMKGKGVAVGKRMSDVIDAGGTHARGTLNTLNTMEDALTRAGDNIWTGPFAKEASDVKKAAKNLGFDVAGLPETEVVDKLNAFLAGEATKQISSRPAQFEFQTYLKNNPGLMTSVEGTKKLIGIMRQTTQQNIKLGRLAMKTNPADWGDEEEKFYNDPKNAILSPFDNKPLGASAPDHAQAPFAPPPSWHFSASRKQYRDPAGKIYDMTGKEVK